MEAVDTAAALGLTPAPTPAPAPAPSPSPSSSSSRAFLELRASPDDAALEGEARSSKKARDDDEEEGEGAGAGPTEGGSAELYQAPGPSGDASAWEDLSMFDSDDLDENHAFLLLCYDAERVARNAQFWIGGESPLSYERDSDIVEVARDFLSSKGLDELPISLVFQGDEDGAFWDHFVNG